MNPILLMGGVNSVLQLGKSAKGALSSATRTGSSSRFEEQLSRALSEFLKNKDADHDGSLSRAELGSDSKTFSKFDTDGNGKLTGNELRAWYLSQGPGTNTGSTLSTHTG